MSTVKQSTYCLPAPEGGSTFSQSGDGPTAVGHMWRIEDSQSQILV